MYQLPAQAASTPHTQLSPVCTVDPVTPPVPLVLTRVLLIYVTIVMVLVGVVVEVPIWIV